MNFKKLSKVIDSNRDWSKGDHSREIEAVKKYYKTAEDGKFKDFMKSKSVSKFKPNDWRKAFKLMQKDQELHGKLPTIFYHEEYEVEDSIQTPKNKRDWDDIKSRLWEGEKVEYPEDWNEEDRRDFEIAVEDFDLDESPEVVLKSDGNFVWFEFDEDLVDD